MKRTIFVCIIGVFTQVCVAQKFSLNQGGTAQKDYFSVIPYENVKGKIIVSAKINHKNFRFILDTGAPNVITQSLYDELKPDILTEIPVGDQSGKSDSMLVVSIDSVTLGGISFLDIPTLVSEELFFAPCFQIDGFIGSNMLRNSIVRFSSSDKTITLTDNKKKLPLTKKQSSKLFLNRIQSSPFFWVKLKDNKQANIPLLFDSGAGGFISISLSHYTKFQKKNVLSHYAQGNGSNTIGLHGFAKDTTVYRIKTKEMYVKGARFQNVSFESTRSSNSRIGAKLLDYGIVTVDYKNKKFYFEPTNELVDMQEKKFPISVTFIQDALSIGIVWGDKYKNQISVGDQIIEIDGENFEHVKPCDMIKRPNFMENDKISLTLKDKSGAVKTIVLQKE